MARHLKVAAAQLSPIHKVASRSSVVAWFLALAKRSSAEEDIPLDCDLDLLPEDRSTLFALAAARAIR